MAYINMEAKEEITVEQNSKPKTDICLRQGKSPGQSTKNEVKVKKTRWIYQTSLQTKWKYFTKFSIKASS